MGRINSGTLNQRITLLTAGIATPDSRGGRIATAPSIAQDLWARVRPLRASEKLALGQVLNAHAYEITIRTLAGVSAKQRITWKGQTLNVQAVTPDEFNEYLLLTCLDSGQ